MDNNTLRQRVEIPHSHRSKFKSNDKYEQNLTNDEKKTQDILMLNIINT